MTNTYNLVSKSLIAGAVIAALGFPASAQSLGAGASIGGGGGISAGAGASVGGSGGIGAGAGASIGGSSGVNAGVGASVGGSSGVGAGVGVGDGVDVGAGVSVGGTDASSTTGGTTNPGLASAVNSMSDSELEKTMLRCQKVVGNSARYDRDLVELCKLVEMASR